MIDRKKTIDIFSPKLEKVDSKAPFQIGNGEICMGMDITGFQTFNEEYQKKGTPLCTMSQWGWHKSQKTKKLKNFSIDKKYYFNNKIVKYSTERTEQNKKEFDWKRQNPHRMNLLEIKLLKNGKVPSICDITNINQKLELFKGTLISKYKINDISYKVEATCDFGSDTFIFDFTFSESNLKDTSLNLFFPYPDSGISGMKRNSEDDFATKMYYKSDDTIILKCSADDSTYFVKICCSTMDFELVDSHDLNIIFLKNHNIFSVSFLKAPPKVSLVNFIDIKRNSVENWKKFWLSTGFIDFSKSINEKASELQRRVILSQYLLKIQSSGSIPPQETGLLCNSWFGKFHLEMHLWHAAYMPMWSTAWDLEKSLKWYIENKEAAEKNAKKNGFCGLRWPKMTDLLGNDSPSPIGTLLIWQQTHIIYLLELIYKCDKDSHSEIFLKKYWELIKGTTDFVCDFLQWSDESQKFELLPPIYPSQEVFDPETVKNPTFELEYWNFCLKISILWAKRLQKNSSKWEIVQKHFSNSTIYNGYYIAHQNCEETFERYNFDHPSMLGSYGLIGNERIDKIAMKKTLVKVLSSWNFESCWGWDFGMLSMAATRLGMPEVAVNILLKDTPKNHYLNNGHNFQELRHDLPSYLPGNGSLLLALGLMVAGYPNSTSIPGFLESDGWRVRYENISPFPY